MQNHKYGYLPSVDRGVTSQRVYWWSGWQIDGKHYPFMQIPQLDAYDIRRWEVTILYKIHTDTHAHIHIYLDMIVYMNIF